MATRVPRYVDRDVGESLYPVKDFVLARSQRSPILRGIKGRSVKRLVFSTSIVAVFMWCKTFGQGIGQRNAPAWVEKPRSPFQAAWDDLVGASAKEYPFGALFRDLGKLFGTCFERKMSF